MIDQIQKAIKQLAEIDALKMKVGMQLTEGQQMGISRALAIDHDAFAKFISTDAGRAATRAFADAFLGVKPAAEPITVSA